MRILHLASEYPPQKVFGLGRFVYDLAGAQAAMGDEVCVITNSLSGERHDIVERGVRVIRVHFPPPPKPAEEATTVMQFNVQLVERALPIIAKWRPDVVNVHDWLTAAAGKVLKCAHGLPLVVTVHDTAMGKFFGQMDNERKFIGRIEQWMCQCADAVIANSNWVKGELIRTYGAADGKVRVVPCAVDVSAFAVTSRPEHLAMFRQVLARPEEPIVLYVGRLDPEKGLEVLAEAMPGVLARHPKAKLVLAGRGKVGKPLGERFKQLGIEGRVLFAGYVRPPALALLYRVADVHVVPSTYEPFGIVALEGMASGRAVVASRTGGLGDIIEHGKSGLLVEPKNPEQLVEAVSVLIGDPGLRERLGGEAKARVAQVFNWQHVAALTREVYGQVAGDSSRTPARAPARAKTGPRVLFDCTAIHEGMTGIGTYAHSLLRHLPQVMPAADWVLLATPRNAELLRRDFGHERVVGGPEFEMCFPSRQQAIARAMTQVRSDVYFGPMYDAPFNGSTKSVTMIHDLAFLKFEGALPGGLGEYTARSAEHAAGRSQVIVTVSESVKEEVWQQYRLAPERVAVAYPGVDDCLGARPPEGAVAEVLAGYAISRPYVLAVNLTNPRKNAAGLVRAFAMLKSRPLGPDLKLVVAGGWDLRESNIWRLAHDALVDRHLVVTGYVSRAVLRCLYAGAAALCMPSFYEGFGMPLAEAMALGVPAVTSDRGAMKEVVAGAGVLADPGDPASIASGLQKVFADSAVREGCIVRGRERASDFTWLRAAGAISAAIQKAVEA
ncbi:MAG TPA: glycosyltransferase [Planctomycetota bacterium]|nr:glycosyltransferase [Planctomycetota bacterium]